MPWPTVCSASSATARSRRASPTATTRCSPSRTSSPQAPLHELVIPTRHIASLADAEPEDAALYGKLMMVAAERAPRDRLRRRGFRVVMNAGARRRPDRLPRPPARPGRPRARLAARVGGRSAGGAVRAAIALHPACGSTRVCGAARSDNSWSGAPSPFGGAASQLLFHFGQRLDVLGAAVDQLDDVEALVAAHRAAELADLHREDQLLDRLGQAHLLAEVAEIAALLARGAVLRELLGQLGEVLAGLRAREDLLGRTSPARAPWRRPRSRGWR